MGVTRSRVAAIVATVLLIAGAVFVASAWARAEVPGGVSGRVYVGPLSAVRHTTPGLDGDEIAYQATIVIRDKDDTFEITRVRSDEHGEFRVVLPPGLYTLRPLEETMPFPKARPIRVQVAAHTFTDVTVLYDLQIQ
jgi:hypothetical protein